MAETFTPMITALSEAEIPYVLTGVMAYGVYADARFTRTIQILTFENYRGEIGDLLSGVGLVEGDERQTNMSFRHTTSGVHIAVDFANSSLEKNALQDPSCLLIFGMSTLVIKQTYLTWIFCQKSPQCAEIQTAKEGFLMVIQMIQDGFLDVNSVRRVMQAAGDNASIEVLDEAEGLAIKARDSSYSKSIEERLARRQSGDHSAASVIRMTPGHSC
jgi:hypothetical protein